MSERLTDPYNLVSGPELASMRSKLSSLLTGMFLSKQLGGNPFIYALCAAKPHILLDKLPGDDGWETAATNGKVFFWHPKFLAKLGKVSCQGVDISEMRIVMEHEVYHNVFWHTSSTRGAGRKQTIWALAIDYVVNTVVWMDHKPADNHAYARAAQQSGSSNVPPPPHPSLLFKPPALGNPISLQELIGVLTGTLDESAAPPKPWMFVDEACDRHSAEWIYDQIMAASPNFLPQYKGGDAMAGIGPLDGHVPSELSKDEANHELLSAYETAKAMGRGDVPAGIQDLIDELGHPTLSPSDIIQSMCLGRIMDEGDRKNYTRYRRRFIGQETPQWIPTTYEFKPRWLCGLDTSGSMGREDMAAGIKELKLVGPESDGIVVPMDAQPYWDKATEIKNVDDLSRIAIHGRGGTVFRQFFEELPAMLGLEWDVIIIITDGMIDSIPSSLAPPCDVLWLITAPEVNFTPAFGRIIRLKR